MLIELAEKFDVKSFEPFLRKIISLLPPRSSSTTPRPLLVMDNHRVHLAKDFRELLSENFEVCFMPAYSCRFNSIEQLWGTAKQSFRRLLLQGKPLL